MKTPVHVVEEKTNTTSDSVENLHFEEQQDIIVVNDSSSDSDSDTVSFDENNFIEMADDSDDEDASNEENETKSAPLPFVPFEIK